MNRRAMFVAAALALAGITLLFVYMKRFERDMSGGDQVELLAAVKPIKRGTVITDEMLTARDVPIAYVESRAIKAAERSKVVGLQSANEIAPQETVMWTDLAITTENRDVSSLVQPGKRAVTVHGTGGDEAALNGLVRPGDYVDVVATMDEGVAPSGAAATGSKERVAVVLLQKVLVLAVAGDTQIAGAGDPKARPGGATDKSITLSLNVKEAQLLALALEKGRVSVAVRNPDDPRISDLPDMPASALADSKARAAAQDTGQRGRSSDQPIKIVESRR
ncbi:MAG: Flp pilus assembly protein CpaB [Polyangiaceae bacterium]